MKCKVTPSSRTQPWARTQKGQEECRWNLSSTPPHPAPLWDAPESVSREYRVSCSSPPALRVCDPTGSPLKGPCAGIWTYSFGGQSTKTWGELDEHTIVLDVLHKTNEQHSGMDFWEALGILATLYCGDQGWLPAKELVDFIKECSKKGWCAVHLSRLLSPLSLPQWFSECADEQPPHHLEPEANPYTPPKTCWIRRGGGGRDSRLCWIKTLQVTLTHTAVWESLFHSFFLSTYLWITRADRKGMAHPRWLGSWISHDTTLLPPSFTNQPYFTSSVHLHSEEISFYILWERKQGLPSKLPH